MFPVLLVRRVVRGLIRPALTQPLLALSVRLVVMQSVVVIAVALPVRPVPIVLVALL